MTAIELPSATGSLAGARSMIVCPLCPLHCDDGVVDARGSLQVPGCSIADQFSGPSAESRNEADFLMRWQASDRRPVVVTSSADLVSARQLSEMHSAGKIHLRIEDDRSLAAIGRATRRDGVVACTLAEIPAHADLVWCVGQVDSAWPRLSERCQRGAIEDRGGVWKSWPCWSADNVADWACGLASDPLIESDLRMWEQSSYAVIVVGPGALVAGEEDLAAAMLGRMVCERNRASRAHLVTLDPAATLRSVCRWQTNDEPPPIQLPMPDHRVSIRLGTPMNGSLVRVDLQIGGLDPGKTLAASYLTAGQSGWNFRSAVIRGDGSISLSLAQPADHQTSAVTRLGEMLAKLSLAGT